MQGGIVLHVDLQPNADETLDCILGGTIHLLQSRSGYRTAIDAPLLAWFAAQHAPDAEQALDLGAGSGLVSLVLARALPHVQIDLLDKQPAMLDRARRNARLNAVDRRFAFLHADVADLTLPARYDLVLCNPPYRRRDHGHPPASSERQIAHQESTATLRQFCHAAVAVLNPTGRSCWVFPAHDASRLLEDLLAVGLGDRSVMRVFHRPNDAQPNRILVCARPGVARLHDLPVRAIHLQDQPDRVFQPDLAAFFASLAEPE